MEHKLIATPKDHRAENANRFSQLCLTLAHDHIRLSKNTNATVFLVFELIKARLALLHEEKTDTLEAEAMIAALADIPLSYLYSTSCTEQFEYAQLLHDVVSRNTRNGLRPDQQDMVLRVIEKLILRILNLPVQI